MISFAIHWTRQSTLLLERPLRCRGSSCRTNKTGVQYINGQKYATTIDKQGATTAATLTAPKRNLIDQMLAGMTNKMGGSAPYSTGVDKLDDQTYATTTGILIATPAAAPMTPKRNLINQLLAKITSKRDFSAPCSTRHCN